MTSPSFVILTQPANCALADGQLLLQAVLEAQELSREGVPVSQAFCDNPAAAESFLEAYARAFAELRLQSPDLPLPEQLYSMVVDGRLAPLPDLNPAPDGPILESAVALQPLVVLSMGAPDALMQALQGNRFAKHNINVVEIPIVKQAESASVTVAAAVAANAVAGASLSAGASPVSRFREDQEGSLASSEGLADAPLKLDDAEFDLNSLETDETDQTHPAAAIVHAAIEMPAAADRSTSPGATRPVHADGRGVDGSNAGSPVSQPETGSQSETRNPATTPPTSANPAALQPTAVVPEAPEPVVVADPLPRPVETADVEQGTPSNPPLGADPAIEPPLSAPDAENPSPTPSPVETADAEQGTPSNPPLGADPAIEPLSSAPDAEIPRLTPHPMETADAEQGMPSNPPTGADPATGSPSSAGDAEATAPRLTESGAGDNLPDAEQVWDATSEIAAPAASGGVDSGATEPGEDLADNGSAFSDPGEDVVYPPTGGFTSDDDLEYPLPLAAAPQVNGLSDILQLSLADEIVDFESMSSSADHATLMAEPFDPILMRAGGPDGLEQHGFPGPAQPVDPGHREKLTPHHETDQDETVTTAHDLDL